MTLLQNLVASIKANVESFEAELIGSNANNAPHLWEAEPFDMLDDVSCLASKETFLLMEKIRVDLRALDAAITPSRYKLVELGMAECKATALNVAVSLGISDAILDLGGSASIEQLAGHLNVNENKLGRVIRALAADFIYAEVSPDVFVNTRHSIVLLKKGNAEPFLSLMSVETAVSATGLCENMSDPKTRHSFAEEDAPFCSTVAQNGETFFQYIMQPEHANVATKVTQGVVPWLNKITRTALLEDYPWDSLADSVVIDVGCGPGDSGFDIMRRHPRLRWVFQDLPHVIDTLPLSVPADLGSKVQAGEVSFVVQDYFEPNVSRGDVWYLRGVIREYDDEKVVDLLRHIAAAMKNTPGARMLINEVFLGSSTITPTSEWSTAAPSAYIPTDQSSLAETGNLMCWSTFHLFAGKERSSRETRVLLQRAGFKISKIFQFRSFTAMLECVLG